MRGLSAWRAAGDAMSRGAALWYIVWRCVRGWRTMDNEEITALKQKLIELRTEHRDLDMMISRLSGDALVDQIQLRRLKKRKLLLKDVISRLESKLIPDLEA